ncbi:MAG: signal peptidase I [Psychrilyobacter sp.]|uniref:signal peptidase I n=1 Tax=Psychrilyobacter sp. TaxID=2586924 RepID=UPI003C713E15
METNKLIINGIFYAILTTFFIFLWLKEKKVVAWIRIYRDRFSDFIISILKIRSKVAKTGVKKTVNFTEAIGSALILVLIIQKFYLGNFMVPTGSMIPTIVPRDRLFGNMVLYKFTEPSREDIIVFKEPVQNKVLYTKRLMGLPGETVEVEGQRLIIDGKKVSERRYSNLGNLGYNQWIVPKKGDKLMIVPMGNYSDEFKERHIDVAKIQKSLLDAPGALSQVLPDVEFYINGKRTGMILDYIHNEEVLKKLFVGKTVEAVIPEDYFLALGDNTDGSSDSRFWGFVAQHRIEGKAFVRFWPLNRIGILK